MAEKNQSQEVSVSLNAPQTIEEMQKTLRIAKCLQGEPVCVLNERQAPQPQPRYYAEVEKWAGEIFESWGFKAISPELGRIELTHRSIKDSNAHKLNPFKAEAYRSIKDVIEQGVVFAETKVGKEEHYFIAAPVTIDNEIDLVTVLVQKNLETQTMYLHSVMIREKILTKNFEQNKTLGYSSSVAETLKNEPEPQGKLYPRDTGKILQNFLKVNISQLEIDLNQQIEQMKGNKMAQENENTAEQQISRQELDERLLAWSSQVVTLHKYIMSTPYDRENPIHRDFRKVRENNPIMDAPDEILTTEEKELKALQQDLFNWDNGLSSNARITLNTAQLNLIEQLHEQLQQKKLEQSQAIENQDKTVEQHLSDLVDEVVAIANQHNQEQVLNEYMQLKAAIRENETQQAEIWGSEEFVDEMKSLQKKHDKLISQKTQIEKDYPTIWQDAERLEQQQMAEIGQADQYNPEIIKNTEFGRQAEKIFQSTAENLQKIENTADERNKDILSKHSVYIEALKKDFQYWVDIGDYDKATERLGDIRINQQMFNERIREQNRQPESISHAGATAIASQTTESEAQSTTGNAKDEIRQKYEQRIDELFSGSPADYSGVHIMEHSDVMDLLGYGDYFLRLNEHKVNLNIVNHPEMTQEQWKKLPDWLDNPAAVIFSRTVNDRLVFVPDEDINGAPVFVIVEPEHKGLNIHLVVNAYARDRKPQQQFENIRDDIANGNCVFVDTKRVSNLLDRSQLQLLGVPSTNANHDKILTENDLEVYRNNRQVDINQGNRIYTVEDIDIEKNHRLVPDLIDADSKIGLTSNRHHETDIDSLIQNIENFNSRQQELTQNSQSQVDEPKNFVQKFEENHQNAQNGENLANNGKNSAEILSKSNISHPETFQKQVMFAKIEETEVSKMIDNLAKERTYLAVDIEHKDIAKGAGAKWDKVLRAWYAEKGNLNETLQQFLPQQPEITVQNRKPYSDFMYQAQKIGIDLNESNFQEKFDSWVRCPVKGKGKSNRDGGYKLFRNDDGSIGAMAKNYSTGDSVGWCDKTQGEKKVAGKVPLADFIANKKQTEWLEIAKNTVEQMVQQMRGNIAQDAYHQLQPALATDPYIQNKGISDIGKLKRLDDGSTIVPLYHNGKIANLQMIPAYDSSKKRLMTQAVKTGAYYSIGNGKNPQTVIIAEGVATADSVHQIATEIYGKDSVLTLSAIDSGSLKAVANKVDKVYPDAQKIIAADNDAHNATRAELKFKNAGLDKANEVQQAYPDFQVALCPALTDEKGVVKNTDWNDFLKAHGTENAIKAFAGSLNGVKQYTPKQHNNAQEHSKNGTDGREH